MSDISGAQVEAKCSSCQSVTDRKCTKCKKPLCEDSSCGMDTVDGYRCGEYTQWGCARKYTNCDTCLDDKAVHEGDLNYCTGCANSMCDTCVKEGVCEKCEGTFCEGCMEEHLSESSCS